MLTKLYIMNLSPPQRFFKGGGGVWRVSESSKYTWKTREENNEPPSPPPCSLSSLSFSLPFFLLQPLRRQRDDAPLEWKKTSSPVYKWEKKSCRDQNVQPPPPPQLPAKKSNDHPSSSQVCLQKRSLSIFCI